MVDDESYKLEAAVRTLAEAAEIKQDDELMEKIKPLMKKKIRSIQGLKDHYESKYNKPSQEEE